MISYSCHLHMLSLSVCVCVMRLESKKQTHRPGRGD